MNFLRSVIALSADSPPIARIATWSLSTSLKHLLKLMILFGARARHQRHPARVAGIDEFARRFDTTVPISPFTTARSKPGPNSLIRGANNDLRFVLDTTARPPRPTPTHIRRVFTADSFLYWVTLTNAPLSHDQHPNCKACAGSRRPRQRRLLPPSTRAMLWLAGTGLAAVRALGDVELPAAGYLFSMVASFMERSMPSPLQLSQLLNLAIHRLTPAAIVVTNLHRVPGSTTSTSGLVYLIVYGFF